jgi:alcohol dehydrogenase class IV
LSALGITEPPIETLAALAMEQWTCGHNPVPMTQQLCIDLYRAVV